MSRVSPHHCLPVLALAALASFASEGAAQSIQRVPGQLRPAERMTLAPVKVDWNDLVALQRLAAASSEEEALPGWLLEPPMVEVPEGLVRSAAIVPPQGGSSEPLCAGFVAEPDLEQSFDSQLDVMDGGGFSYIPPDTAGGVGPDHLMTALNNKVLIQDRLGGAVSSVDLSTFWSPLAGTSLTYPRVFHDNVNARWVSTARSGSTGGGTTAILLAVSDTSDPTGTWNYYSITADPGATSFADWTMPGANTTWIAISANMFDLAGTTFLGAKLWVIDQTTVGGSLTVTVFPTGYPTALTGAIAGSSSFQVAQTYDATPSLYLVSDAFSSGGTNILQVFEVTGTGASPAVSGIPGSGIVSATSGMTFVTTTFSTTQRTMPQVGDARFISPFSVRVQSVVARNGKLWVVHNGGTPGPSGNTTPSQTSVCWYEIDPTLMPAGVAQSGQISSGATGAVVSMPSIAVNCAEDVVIGFSRGDATRNPECSYAVRLGSDPLNMMGPIRTLKTGDSSYWKNFGVGTTAQWGRYSSSAVDPNDDHTLWTLQEYAGLRVGPADNDSRWATRWGRLGSCGAPTIDVEPMDVTICTGDPAAFSVTATASNAPLVYQWRKDGMDLVGETASTLSIAAAMVGDAGVYDVLVTDGCGQTLSLPATLSFAGPTITTQPTNVSAATGAMASFNVAATGTGTLSYQWLFNGNPIALANADTYTIASVSMADYGFYSVIVTDDCGPVTSATAQLLPPVSSGKIKPAQLSLHVFQGPQDTSACDGGMATFSVLAFPENVTYSWRFNGVPIAPPETGSTLVVDPVSGAEVGQYDVVVSLGAQSVTSAPAMLTLATEPVFTMQPSPSNVVLLPGDSITYTVAATGATEYQWRFKPNIPFVSYMDLPGETGPSLTLDNLTPADSGRYICVARNACGGKRSTPATLTIF